jgi:hypothetical protein
MTDTSKQRPVQVRTVDDISYLRVPEELVERIHKLFEENNVPHWVENLILSVDGGPRMVVIHLSRKADPRRAQELLDAIP